MRANAPNSSPLALLPALVLVLAAATLVPPVHARTHAAPHNREAAARTHTPSHSAKPAEHSAPKPHKSIRLSAKRSEQERRHDKIHEPSKRTAFPVKVAATAPEPKTGAESGPEPQVIHDRKIHYTAPASDPTASTEAPRKATVADFLTPFPAAAPKPEMAAKPIAPTAPVSLVRQPPAPVVRGTPAQPPAEHSPVDPWGFEALPAAPAVQKAAALPQATKPTERASTANAAPPVILPALYSSNGRLILPPALKGSREILLHQNEVADREGLDRIQDDLDLEHMRAAHLLVPLPASNTIVVDERLPLNRRYTRPWTAKFLADLGRAYYGRFHEPLQINSAVRTVEFQERLIEVNANAAPAEGETASPHLTGQAVDLAKHGLSITEIAWMRAYLLPLVQQGKVDVEEEFQQACFHISVYKNYMPEAAPRRHSPGAALATAMR